MVFNNCLAPYNMDFKNADSQTWKDRIIEASSLNFDAHDGNYILRKDLMPSLFMMSLIWNHDLTFKNLYKRLLKKMSNVTKDILKYKKD